MLFRVGDFSAMIAVVAYSMAPAIRYTDHGIRQVPAHIIEAATAAGCTRRQLLWRVQIPLALPEIMLGVNQTVMLGLSMLVITALVGTRDLGQEVYIALTKADSGRGLVAGVCVACIAMTSDRLISAWSRRKKQELPTITVDSLTMQPRNSPSMRKLSDRRRVPSNSAPWSMKVAATRAAGGSACGSRRLLTQRV